MELEKVEPLLVVVALMAGRGVIPETIIAGVALAWPYLKAPFWSGDPWGKLVLKQLVGVTGRVANGRP